MIVTKKAVPSSSKVATRAAKNTSQTNAEKTARTS
jgi:hypothetical protein